MGDDWVLLNFYCLLLGVGWCCKWEEELKVPAGTVTGVPKRGRQIWGRV